MNWTPEKVSNRLDKWQRSGFIITTLAEGPDLDDLDVITLTITLKKNPKVVDHTKGA